MSGNFPNGAAHPSARLTTQDRRVLALIERHLRAERALRKAYSAFEDTDTPEAEAVFELFSAAVLKPEDELARIAEGDQVIREWLENIGGSLENSRFRKQQAG
jgi:hypothetical protein